MAIAVTGIESEARESRTWLGWFPRWSDATDIEVGM